MTARHTMAASRFAGSASTFSSPKRACLSGLLMACALALPALGFSQSNFRHLRNHVPSLVNRAQRLGRVAGDESIELAVTLPLRNEAQLDSLLFRIYDPADPQYGHFLTPEQFTARFAPTQDDYDQVMKYLQSQGLTVTNTHANRLVLDVKAPARTVENAFGLRLNRYQSPEGKVFRAPDSDPALPQNVAGKVQSLIGLDDADVWVSHSVGKPVAMQPGADLFGPGMGGTTLGSILPLDDPQPLQTGSGPGGGLTPSDIKKAYNLNTTTLTGSGQTLALFELDGYKASDIAGYESYYGLPSVTLQNILVDNAKGTAGSGAGEVTLDIELQIALAPGASKILVYEGPNSTKGVIDTYNQIAADNLAKSVSTSWGLAETYNSSNTQASENTIFKQMASQGQSIFAASGDSGAYDNGSTLTVDDPASQPYVTGVGGTKLTTNGAGGPYSVETTWNGGSVKAGGGGGGVSAIWTIPSYQIGFGSAASKASTTMRNVPDVSLDADPNSGYSIYFNGGWYIYGGTSCAAPLWSAFTALVNQQRVIYGKAVLGFANPPLYAVGATANYAQDFHDIADGSTNLYYPAVAGYDLATGLGTFNGVNLLADLAGPPPAAAPTAGISGLFGTGLDSGGNPVADGASDPHYTLAKKPGGSGGAAYVTLEKWPIQSGVWMLDTNTSKWISPTADESAYADDAGSYTYQTTFTVAGDATTVKITGRVAGDDAVTAIILNGVTVATNVSSGFNAWSTFTISGNFVTGTNTLQFVVANNGTSANPTGFRCEMAAGTVTLVPGSITNLFGTGLNSGGAAAADASGDVHYSLVGTPGGSGGAAYVTMQKYPIQSGVWMLDTNTSKWISPTADESAYADAPGTYTYQTNFTVAGDATTVKITGRVAGDDAVTAIILNGVTVATNVSSGFNAWSTFTISGNFVTGTNTLQFVVANAGTSANPTGFRSEMVGGSK